MTPSRPWLAKHVLTAALALALAACSSDGTAPNRPGELRAVVVSPDGDLGAAVLELEGVAGITPVAGRAFTERNGDILRVVIVLDEPGQIEFLIRLSDMAGQPAATIVEVADGDNQVPESISGYRVEFSQ